MPVKLKYEIKLLLNNFFLRTKANGKGKCEVITVENVGGEDLLSTYSEKLLGLHINADFVWSTHIDKLSIELKKRTGLLRRIQKRVPKEKIVIIAEAIFNSLLRYGVAVFLKPVYDKEDLKMKKLPKDTTTLQTLQNSMLRVIFGLRLKNHINMKNVREEIKMMSVNQISVYHTLLEAYNVMRHLSSEQIHMKWKIIEKKYALRSITKKDLNVPEKPKLKCLGFTYNGAKLFNMLPCRMREPRTLIYLKHCQKSGYGKISLHINHHNLFISYIMIAVCL